MATERMSLMKLTPFTLFLAHVVGSVPLLAEEKGGWLQDAASTISNVVGNLFGGVVSADEDWTSGRITLDAETVLKEKNDNILVGERLMQQGRTLRTLAGNIARRVVAAATDPGDVRELHLYRKAVLTLLKTSRDVIDIGQGVIRNNERISDAMGDALDDVKYVMQTSLADVGEDILETGRSIQEAFGSLVEVIRAADGGDSELYAVDKALRQSADLVVEVGNGFQNIGVHSLTLVRRVAKMGRDIVQVMGDAAQNVVTAAGVTG